MTPAMSGPAVVAGPTSTPAADNDNLILGSATYKPPSSTKKALTSLAEALNVFPHNDSTCHGWDGAHGRRCRVPLLLANRTKATSMLTKIVPTSDEDIPPKMETIKYLEEIAELVCCWRHSTQSPSMAISWLDKLDNFIVRFSSGPNGSSANIADQENEEYRYLLERLQWDIDANIKSMHLFDGGFGGVSRQKSTKSMKSASTVSTSHASTLTRSNSSVTETTASSISRSGSSRYRMTHDSDTEPELPAWPKQAPFSKKSLIKRHVPPPVPVPAKTDQIIVIDESPVVPRFPPIRRKEVPKLEEATPIANDEDGNASTEKAIAGPREGGRTKALPPVPIRHAGHVPKHTDSSREPGVRTLAKQVTKLRADVATLKKDSGKLVFPPPPPPPRTLPDEKIEIVMKDIVEIRADIAEFTAMKSEVAAMSAQLSKLMADYELRQKAAAKALPEAPRQIARPVIGTPREAPQPPPRRSSVRGRSGSVTPTGNRSAAGSPTLSRGPTPDLNRDLPPIQQHSRMESSSSVPPLSRSRACEIPQHALASDTIKRDVIAVVGPASSNTSIFTCLPRLKWRRGYSFSSFVAGSVPMSASNSALTTSQSERDNIRSKWTGPASESNEKILPAAPI